jgi:hypothetical protein
MGEMDAVEVDPLVRDALLSVFMLQAPCASKKGTQLLCRKPAAAQRSKML